MNISYKLYPIQYKLIAYLQQKSYLLHAGTFPIKCPYLVQVHSISPIQVKSPTGWLTSMHSYSNRFIKVSWQLLLVNLVGNLIKLGMKSAGHTCKQSLWMVTGTKLVQGWIFPQKQYSTLIFFPILIEAYFKVQPYLTEL